MFRLLRVAILREYISQNKCRCLKISSLFTNEDDMSCGSSPVSFRSSPDSIKGQLKGDFWWIRVAMGQFFLLILQCSSVSTISPLLHTYISLIYHWLWISPNESISQWNTSPSFRGRTCRPCGNLVISPQIELIVTTLLWYSESGFRARLGENFCKANSSVIQSVSEWLVSSFASRVIWRCVEELST